MAEAVIDTREGSEGWISCRLREGAEQLGQAVLLVALDDLTVTEYILEPGTEPGIRTVTRTTRTRSM
jgi:hypothetical protein